ncbi:hypothetical protein [Burkholderia gladioli]|uniref:hypothetical protein n=1 Tax=Burkholderia gladioli TaxID=28095 RepID=UPI0016405A41|nr:hypothetical protein [Burkholderia gladioli]
MKHKIIERLAIKNGLVISKSDAAERQLRTAIWLWFHDFDPVPIHGLASASVKVLWMLHKKHKTGHKTIREEVIDRARPEYQRSFIDMLNETENFIKHADRDPFGFHTFNPESTIFVLLDGVRSLSAFNGSYPLESRAFMTWFLINRPGIIDLSDTPQHEIAAKQARDFRAISKPEFYKHVTHLIMKAQEIAADEQHP